MKTAGFHKDKLANGVSLIYRECYKMKRKCVVLSVLLLSVSSLGVCSNCLDRARKLYLLGEYDNSISELTGNGERHCSDEELYLLGMNYLKVGEYPRARNHFRSLMKNCWDSALYERAFVKLGDAFFLEGSYSKAGGVYRSILTKYRKTRFKPVLYLRMAQIAAKEGDWDKEAEYIEILKKEYPQSVERRYADILEERGYFFTVQVGAFSRKVNAAGVIDELGREFSSYMVKEKMNDITLYKVRVGKYPQKRSAEKVCRVLVNRGYPARIYP